jgi:hypothetical protein
MGDERSELKKSPRRVLGLLTRFLAGDYAVDKPFERKRLLRTLIGLLAGFLIGNYVVNWHVILDHGFGSVRYDHFVAQAIGAIGISICFWLLGRQKEVTTLGIGDATAKKVR